MLKYKVGDKVTLKNKEALKPILEASPYTCVTAKLAYAGREMTIRHVHEEDYNLVETSHNYHWTDNMFEKPGDTAVGITADREVQLSLSFIYL